MSAVSARRREEGRLFEVVIDAPKGNVLTAEVLVDLASAVAGAASDRALRLIAIRGAGAHFSFGASVEEHQRPSAPRMLAAFHRAIRAVGTSPIPVAAVVDGRCLGGAFELALACHFTLATPRAIFACPEIKLGVLPPVLAAIGPLRLGAALTERLLLTGAELGAAEAQAAGFVSAIAPPGVELEAWSIDWYRKFLAPLSAFALRQGVRAARRGAGWERALAGGIDEAERQYLETIVPSLDGQEGIAAFLARRAPAWTDQ